MHQNLAHQKNVDIAVPSYALDIAKALNKHGHSCYVVGGYVRDYFAQLNSKDVDLVTDATPEQIKHIFQRKCILIGRRFRLAHVRAGREVVEVSTFRGHQEAEGQRAHSSDGIILRDNVYGTLEEDIQRRDFSINAMYYDPTERVLVDTTNGLSDIQDKVIRLMGDPQIRLQEDPVRIWRAIRFANKLGFALEPNLAAAIHQTAKLLDHIPPGRRFDEYTKLLLHGYGQPTMNMLREFDVVAPLFPHLEEGHTHTAFLQAALRNTDDRLASGKSVNPAFLLAVVLWPEYQRYYEELQRDFTMPPQLIRHKAASIAIERQASFTSIPKRFSATVRQIWNLQGPMQQRKPRQVKRILHDPKFRAAYDFLLLRAIETPDLQPLADWWTKLQDDKHRDEMIQSLGPDKKKRRRRRKHST